MKEYQAVYIIFIDKGPERLNVSEQFSESTEFCVGDALPVEDPRTKLTKNYRIKRLTRYDAFEDADTDHPDGYYQRTWTLGLTLML